MHVIVNQCIHDNDIKLMCAIYYNYMHVVDRQMQFGDNIHGDDKIAVCVLEFLLT